MLNIVSNGSKWCGDSPDDIGLLLSRLAAETLDPTFEAYGDFVYLSEDGKWKAFGNFYSYSHVFNIEADAREELAGIEAAVRANQATPSYAQAKAQIAARKEAARKREEERLRNQMRDQRAGAA